MSANTSNLSLGRETLIAIIAKFALAVTGFAGIIIFARVLGPNRLGTYYFLLTLGQYGMQFTNGVGDAIRKRVSEVGVEPGEFFGVGLAVHAAFSIVVLALLVTLYPFVNSHFGSFQLALGVVAILGVLGAFTIVNQLYAGVGNPGASFWTDSVRSVLTLALQLLFLWLGWQVLGLMAGFILATGISAIGVAILVRVRPRLPTRATVKRTVDFARWSVPNSLMHNLYSRLDVLILATIVGHSAVGLYEPALRLTLPAYFMATSIGNALVVKASGLNSLQRDVQADLSNAISYTSLLAIPIFFGALAIPTELMVTVYGPEYRDGWTVLVGLALFQVLNTYHVPFDKVINGIDRPELQFKVSIFSVAINVPLAIILGLNYGLVGVVIATILTEVTRIVAYQFLMYSLFETVFVTKPLLKQFFGGIVMFVVVYGISENVVSISSWKQLALVVGLGALTYFVTLLAISPHFRLTIRNVFGDVRPA